MRTQEARSLLGLAEGPVGADEVRGAYLQRVQTIRLDVDPEGFVEFRDAFELLSHGAGAPASEVNAAREELAGQPDAAEARWWLLSYFPYATSPEAFPVLCDGAARRPDAFLDELLFHFPERVPAAIVAGAHDGASLGRLLLLADVHATQGRSGEAVEVLRAALAAGALRSPALVRLATRPLFSLQAHAQLAAAGEALALVRRGQGDAAADGRQIDLQTTTMLAVADELGRLGDTLPLDVRQAAARAARQGDFTNLPYDARYAIRLMKPREVRKLNDSLRREAPTLAGLLSLESHLASTSTPDFRIHVPWIAVAIYVAIRLSLTVWRWTHHRGVDVDKLLKSVNDDLVHGIEKDIDRACADPDSEKCRPYRTLFSNGTAQADAGSAADSEEAPQ